MQLYRFSPVHSQPDLMAALNHIHLSCSQLCLNTLGYILPNAGNIGFFCHYDEEYAHLTTLRQALTEASVNPQQKYFRLLNPLIFAAQGSVPSTTYTHLYIRKPDPYRHHVGDVDYYLPPNEYTALKQRLLNGEKISGARIFPRTDLDMIELYNPDVDCLAYISTSAMVEKVRIHQGQSIL